MAGVSTEQLPGKVAAVVQEVNRFLGVLDGALFVADHTHEELSEGAYSLAYEGDYDWPHRFTEAVHAGEYSKPRGVFLEAGTGWYLAVYPDDSDDKGCPGHQTPTGVALGRRERYCDGSCVNP